MKIGLALFMLALPMFALHAQLSDDFSDGEFMTNPPWIGHTDRFIVNASGELQLNDLMAGANNTAYLSVAAPTGTQSETTWEFLARLAFAPSTSNFSRVYLTASQSDLTTSLNGYYVKVGGVSGDTDALELYRQDGSGSTLLISGTAGAVSADPALARVRVTRSSNGLWTLWADYTGGNAFTQEGTATDLTYPAGAFFGVYCRYTATRNTSFFFDDVLIDPLFQDTEPPMLVGAEAISATQVAVHFSEPVSAASAELISNYTIAPAIGNPTTATIDIQDPTSVLLELATALGNLTTYTLQVVNISDVNGNALGSASADFQYFNVEPALPGEVVITEIMADPTPTVGLPDAEYLELYNRSNKVIQLEGWTLVVGTSTRTLPATFLLPGAYLTLCGESAAPMLAPFGPALGLSSFPALTNSGASLVLRDAGSVNQFAVTYSDSWYRDATKAQGGWSLELIQPEGPYDCPGNWRASEAANGGTPGQANSLLGTVADNVAPVLRSAAAGNATEIHLVFDERLDPVSAADPAQYQLTGGISIADAIVLSPDFLEVTLFLETPLQSGQVYLLSFHSGVSDCMGNATDTTRQIRLGLAETPAPRDIIINEVLFNPNSGGSDFVEFYNRSSKVINLHGLKIANTIKLTGTLETTVGVDYLLFPGEYAVVTDDPDDILSRYTVLNPDALIDNALPGLDDDAGNVTLRAGLITIDSFDYNEDMHFALLSSRDGVSLERLNPEFPTNSAANWHSAAGTAGFATPTYVNSEFLDAATENDGVVSLEKKVFSPDGDGDEDLLLVQVNPDRPGFVINLNIFDAQGLLVRRIARNELLGLDNLFKWDGANDDNERARVGIYVVWAELFNPDGTTRYYKKSCVLARKLE